MSKPSKEPIIPDQSEPSEDLEWTNDELIPLGYERARSDSPEDDRVGHHEDVLKAPIAGILVSYHGKTPNHGYACGIANPENEVAEKGGREHAVLTAPGLCIFESFFLKEGGGGFQITLRGHYGNAHKLQVELNNDIYRTLLDPENPMEKLCGEKLYEGDEILKVTRDGLMRGPVLKSLSFSIGMMPGTGLIQFPEGGVYRQRGSPVARHHIVDDDVIREPGYQIPYFRGKIKDDDKIKWVQIRPKLVDLPTEAQAARYKARLQGVMNKFLEAKRSHVLRPFQQT